MKLREGYGGVHGNHDVAWSQMLFGVPECWQAFGEEGCWQRSLSTPLHATLPLPVVVSLISVKGIIQNISNLNKMTSGPICSDIVSSQAKSQPFCYNVNTSGERECGRSAVCAHVNPPVSRGALVD